MGIFGAPRRIRTRSLPGRSRLLYPVELLAHNWHTQRGLNPRLRLEKPANVPLFHGCKLAGERGLEPRLTGSEPVVLPLDDSPKLAEGRGFEPLCRFPDVCFQNRCNTVLPAFQVGALGGIRTHSLKFRKLPLYPVEPQAQTFVDSLRGFKIRSLTIARKLKPDAYRIYPLRMTPVITSFQLPLKGSCIIGGTRGS